MHRRSGDGASDVAVRRHPWPRRWSRGLFAVCCALSALTAAASARASDGLWLITRVDVGAAKPAEVDASRRLTQLLRARGYDVLDGAGAGSEFERRHSRAVKELPASKVTELDAALRKLADELASENLEQAQKLIADIEVLSPDIRDQLNRETQRARRRFHICLLAAHLFSKEGYQNESLEQVRKCARDFPGLEPEQGPYLPESIRKFFVHAHTELERIPPSAVHIDVENGSAQNCRARINGIDRGPTPATVDAVRTQRIRVAVDCAEQSGRIYDIALEPGDNSIRIDLELDRAVQTQPALGLRYADAQAAANNRMLHNLRLARAINASYVLQIWNGELHRIDVAARKDTMLGELTTPLEQLIDGMEAAQSSGAGLEAPPLAISGSDGRPAPFRTLGWVTAGAAVLTGGGVFIAWRVREDAVLEFNDESRGEEETCSRRFAALAEQPPDCPEHLERADAAESVMYVLGFSAIALAGLAATFFLIDAQQDTDESVAAQGCGPGPGELGVSCQLRF
jgi:hypothetical protein